MGIAARTLAEKHSFDRNVTQVLAIYKEILAERRPETPEVQPAMPRARRFSREAVRAG